MAVSVDSVYQQVLAIANKEQRGYITPQEFNLFARKAQQEVYESTFQDYKDAFLHPEQVVGQHNDLNMLREKIAPFRAVGTGITVAHATGIGTLDDTAANIYWIESIYDMTNNIVFEEVTKRQVNYFKDYFAAKGFPLNLEHVVFQGTNGNLEFRSKHVFYRHSTNQVMFYPVKLNDAGDGVHSSFAPKADYVKPLSAFDDPKWDWVVTANQPLYKGSTSKDFQVHHSEESTLVNKVLELSGIALEKQPLSDAALRNEQMKKADKSN
tara:strand:- start:314 stop:1114 length:801 start_codon:yes stop_codon:yes gene_type:complete